MTGAVSGPAKNDISDYIVVAPRSHDLKSRTLGTTRRFSVTAEFVYAVAAMIFYGLSDFIYKRAATAGLRADHFLVVQAWVFCPLILLYAAMTHTLGFKLAALWGSLAGVFVFIGFYNFIRSLVGGSVSTYAAIFRLNFIVTALLAIVFLGEPLTFAKTVGLLLALFATWLLLGRHKVDKQTADVTRQRSLVQVLLATLAVGAATFFHAVGLRQGASPETLVAAQATLFTPLAMTFSYVVEGAIRPPRATWRYGASAAVLLLTAFLLLLRSLAHGEASVLVPIAQMGFVVTAALGIIFLKEPFDVRKAAGLVVAFVALGVLAAS
jgi:drug/metabolite transporter (DMT)-like permease